MTHDWTPSPNAGQPLFRGLGRSVLLGQRAEHSLSQRLNWRYLVRGDEQRELCRTNPVGGSDIRYVAIGVGDFFGTGTDISFHPAL
jgi:hypothetical protein